ncbi:capsular polysaccharide biosynthesis protein-like protein [Brachyspira sp. CAG:484]|nr:capsular polysaccharide biosynthesis protein-like protein [Brachyspira sp. CAG:484]
MNEIHSQETESGLICVGEDGFGDVEPLRKHKLLKNNKFLCLFVMNIVKVFMNFIPDSDLKQKMRTLKKILYLNIHSFDVEDYCKEKKLENFNYFAGNYKLSIVNDLYVNIYSFYSYIYDEDKNLIRESVLDNKIVHLPKHKLKLSKSNVIELDEAVCLSLLCLKNLWHFTFQGLDKILALEEAGYKGKYLVFDTEFIRKLLQFCDIPDNKIIFVKEGQIYKVKKLHIIHNCGLYDKNVLQQIKRRVISKIDMSDISKYPKKLFVRRIGYSRKLKNEEEIIKILKKYGFEMMFPDDYPFEEQIKYFYAADVVFTPHGANSTNALFMREGTRFIECFGRNYITPFMQDIIQDNKMLYNMLVEWNYSSKAGKKDSDYQIKSTLVENTVYNL